MSEETKKQGFAALTPERRSEIARQGGQTIARNREHMANIGRKGGEKAAQNKTHMAAIGKKGGIATSQLHDMSVVSQKGVEARRKKKDGDTK